MAPPRSLSGIRVSQLAHRVVREQGQFVSVDNESHINVRLQTRATCGTSFREPLFGGMRTRTGRPKPQRGKEGSGTAVPHRSRITGLHSINRVAWSSTADGIL